MNTSNGANVNGTFDSGFIGNSIYFSNSAYVRLENSNSTNFGIAAGKEGKLTLMCWFYPTENTTNPRVVISNEYWDNGTNPGITIDTQYQQAPYFNFGDGTVEHRKFYKNEQKLTVANKWQFVAISADLTTGKADLYYGIYNDVNDGSLQKLTTLDISTIDTFVNSNKWYIATDLSNKDYYFRGSVDEVAFWNRALTTEEITSIFNNQVDGIGLGVQLARADGGSVTQNDGAWSTDTNWSYKAVPDSQTDVIINHSITDSADRTVNANLTINSDGSYTSSGTLTLGVDENLTGTLTLNGGTVNVDGLVLSSNSGVNLSSGTLNIGSSSTLYNLSGGSESNPATLTVDGDLTLSNDDESTFIGSITAQKITVDTANEVALKLYAGANNKVTADSLTVSSGELDFRGYFEGSIEVFNGSVFSPGNSIGEADITGNITFKGATADSNGVAWFEFGEYADGADVNHDLFVMQSNGTFTADDGVILLDFANNDADSWAAVGNEFQLVSGGGFDANVDYNPWLGNMTDLFKLEGRTADGLYLIGIKAAPEPGSGVPEPSTWALLLLGAAGLLYVRKRTGK
ncbi:MAG: PEP-CTERM sorting domain-containing protein [Thermoguttaceae bacterium]|nr:PEP-CTERM sorting domain-containing protein [Thermoguttaceae bacterium]